MGALNALEDYITPIANSLLYITVNSLTVCVIVKGNCVVAGEQVNFIPSATF